MGNDDDLADMLEGEMPEEPEDDSIVDLTRFCNECFLPGTVLRRLRKRSEVLNLEGSKIIISTPISYLDAQGSDMSEEELAALNDADCLDYVLKEFSRLLVEGKMIPSVELSVKGKVIGKFNSLAALHTFHTPSRRLICTGHDCTGEHIIPEVPIEYK